VALSRTYKRNENIYGRIFKDVSNKENEPVASIVLTSGCRENELSQDGTYNGYFTSNLKKIWVGGKFKGSYKRFYKLVYNNMMASDQHPKYFKDGKQNPSFEKARPFTI